MKKYILSFCFFTLSLMALTGCEKEYYFDKGLHKPNYNGTMLKYLEEKPILFDTLVKVIKLAKMESYFTDSSITFFAPADSSIMKTYAFINASLKSSGADTLKNLSDIKEEFWRSTLLMYMFRGETGLEDYPQLDLANRQAFPGDFVKAMSGRVMNVGTVFTDARGIKYQGYRYLNISYVPSEAAPYNSWISVPIATSNIKPLKGIMHVLVYRYHEFGFDADQAYLNAKYFGFNKSE